MTPCNRVWRSLPLLIPEIWEVSLQKQIVLRMDRRAVSKHDQTTAQHALKVHLHQSTVSDVMMREKGRAARPRPLNKYLRMWETTPRATQVMTLRHMRNQRGNVAIRRRACQGKEDRRGKAKANDPNPAPLPYPRNTTVSFIPTSRTK